MGKLNDYKKNNPEIFEEKTNVNENFTIKENVPIKVSGYELGGTLDTNFILGTRLDTKENIKVRLIEIDQNPSSKYKRVEVSEFGNPANRKRYVNPDCFMVFENATKAPDGTYLARWGVVLDREPNGTKVMVMQASLLYFSKEVDGAKKEYYQIKALVPRPPIEVSDMEVFSTEVGKSLTPNFNGSKPFVYVRISDEEGGVIVFEIRTKQEDVVDENAKYKRSVKNGLDSLEEYKTQNPNEFKTIEKFIGDQDVKVEIIKGSVIYPGAATKEKMDEMHQNSKQILIKQFHVKSDEEEAEQPRFPKTGFLPCILATRIHTDGTPYLTYIKAVQLFTEAESIEKLQNFNNFS